MSVKITHTGYVPQFDYKTQTYYFVPAYTKPPQPLEDQIAALRKELDELKQELTVIKTLIQCQ